MTARTARSYRWPAVTVANIQAIQDITGDNFTGCVEHAVAWYLAGLRAGCIPAAGKAAPKDNPQPISKPRLYIEKG